jgi:hypothetical protein
LKLHIVLPVSGSSVLMPADAAGSPGFGAAGVLDVFVRPMYWRPASYVTSVLMYCCPFSEYARYIQPVAGL